MASASVAMRVAFNTVAPLALPRVRQPMWRQQLWRSNAKIFLMECAIAAVAANFRTRVGEKAYRSVPRHRRRRRPSTLTEVLPTMGMGHMLAMALRCSMATGHRRTARRHRMAIKRRPPMHMAMAVAMVRLRPATQEALERTCARISSMGGVHEAPNASFLMRVNQWRRKSATNLFARIFKMACAHEAVDAATNISRLTRARRSIDGLYARPDLRGKASSMPLGLRAVVGSLAQGGLGHDEQDVDLPTPGVAAGSASTPLVKQHKQCEHHRTPREALRILDERDKVH